MQHTISSPYSGSYSKSHSPVSLWKRFIQWADGQEKNRFGWTAGILAGHGCVFTILTAMIILLSGNHFVFWPVTIFAMAACLIVNLAAMPTRITIPVFFFSLLADLAVIVICLLNGFNISAMYP